MFYKTYRKIIVSVTFIIYAFIVCTYLFHCIGWILPSTLLIGYYHSLLMRDIDPCAVMDKMCSLAPHDRGTILAGHSIYQRSWLLLEHVRHMEVQMLLKFCEFVQEFLPQVGLQLVTGM